MRNDFEPDPPNVIVDGPTKSERAVNNRTYREKFAGYLLFSYRTF